MKLYQQLGRRRGGNVKGIEAAVCLRSTNVKVAIEHSDVMIIFSVLSLLLVLKSKCKYFDL